MKNWKKHTLEFISIFVAVISAFALENWNEARKNKIVEERILTEIYYGLEKDLEDINGNAGGHENGNRAVAYFIDLIAGEPVSEDSVVFKFFVLTRDFISIQNTSGYETLKSKGLEIIRNDSLRTNIISLYEYNYNSLRKLEEEYFEMQFQANYFEEINQIISKSLKIDENKNIVGINTPLNISENEEKLLLMYLFKIRANRNFILREYAGVKEKVKKLMNEIKIYKK